MRAILIAITTFALAACAAPPTGQQPQQTATQVAQSPTASPPASPTGTASPGVSPTTASPTGSPAGGSPATGRTAPPTVPVAQVQPTAPPGAGGVEIVIETAQRQGPLGLALALLVAAAIVLTLSWALRRR
jgi:hypothetical protein